MFRNEKGLLIYGAYCTVVVVDTLRNKIIKTLERHTSAITHVGCFFSSSRDVLLIDYGHPNITEDFFFWWNLCMSFTNFCHS